MKRMLSGFKFSFFKQQAPKLSFRTCRAKAKAKEAKVAKEVRKAKMEKAEKRKVNSATCSKTK